MEDAAYLEKWSQARSSVCARGMPSRRILGRTSPLPGRYGATEHETLADNAYFNFAAPHAGERTHRPPGQEPARDRGSRAQGCARWDKVHDLVEKAAPLIPADRRQFFQSHVRTQLDIHRYGNRMLLDLLDSRTAASTEAKRAKVASAIENGESAQRALHAAEYGQWAGFYAGDLMVAVGHTLALARAYDLKLQGKPLPADLVLDWLPGDPYQKIKASRPAASAALGRLDRRASMG